jgi:hypothetical protein
MLDRLNSYEKVLPENKAYAKEKPDADPAFFTQLKRKALSFKHDCPLTAYLR